MALALVCTMAFAVLFSTDPDGTSARAGVLIAGTGTRSGGGGAIVVIRPLKETLSAFATFSPSARARPRYCAAPRWRSSCQAP
jgi:hypothetical protein